MPLLLLAGTGGAGAPAEPPAERADSRPNVVFILTDDQDLQLGSLDFMPNVRALIADQGLTFTHDFVSLSLCCPSRSSILTGEYAHNHQVYSNFPPDGGYQQFVALGLEATTIGTAMHAAGYRTALMGKYLNSYPAGAETTHVPPGWDEWDVPVNGAAYGGFNYTLNQNGALVPHGHAPADYMTDVLAARARDFITAAGKGPAPFFLYVASYAPHKPATPAPRHTELFPNAQVPRTPSFNEADVRDKPEQVRTTLLSAEEIAALDRLYRRRLQALQAVDEMVAGLVQTLQATGQLANTYIFFTSDNGFHMGQHRLRAGKYTPYEEDVRVPLLVRGPGVPAGKTTDAFTLNVDFAPTIAALGGATLKTRFDGRSLVPLLHGGPTPAGWRRAVFLEQFNFLEEPQDDGGILEPAEDQDGIKEYPSRLGLRTATYKFVEYTETGEREVYDLVKDPGELQNIGPRMNAKFLNRLSGIVRALGTCSGASCRQLDAAPMPALP